LDKKAIYRKTLKGVAEITASARTVERRLRPLLILVDGNRTANYIHSLVSGIGIREDDFDLLCTAGFIEPIAFTHMPVAVADRTEQVPAAPPAPPHKRTLFERYSDGKRYLTETAADKLGLKSFLFVLKLEKTSSPEDLLALLPDFEAALARKFDKLYARNCRRIAESILQG
jgi:hypothetical protein